MFRDFIIKIVSVGDVSGDKEELKKHELASVTSTDDLLMCSFCSIEVPLFKDYCSYMTRGLFHKTSLPTKPGLFQLL